MKLLLYFCDAFAWRYCQQTDFMMDFWTTCRPLRTLLGYSSGIVPSLLSGKYPRETGVWTEYYRSPRPQTRLERALTSSRLTLAPANIVRLVLFHCAMRLGSPAVHQLRLPLELGHFFKHAPIDYRRFPPIELPVPTLDQVFKQKGLRFETRYLKPGRSASSELEYLRSRLPHVDIMFYYDIALDHKGHHVGASASRLKPELDRIAHFFEQAWALRESAEWEMLLFSDHGMTDVDTKYDLLHALRDVGLGKQFLVFVDSTLARFWFSGSEVRETIMARLGRAPARFLTVAEKEELGIDFEDDRYGQEILVAEEGAVFQPSFITPAFNRHQPFPLRAMHGYLPEFPSSYGIFAYRGSRYLAEIPNPMPAVDLFSVITAILEADA
ncbi:MAG: hypothetical protein EPO21_11870 [Chloroflexota bacterium]|nr:MAG: hypothetical protein EPO21_11870 [Chloroflexota bacterium]